MQLKLITTKPETPSVTSFLFEKPAGFSYQAGQFINITFAVNNCDNRCNSRNYTLSSSPTQEFLMISTRHGVSRFKQTLEQFPPGVLVDVKGPFGKFVLNEDPNREAVFVTGGIGITPFHSMLNYTTDKGLPKKITLLYANKATSDIPFQLELEQLAQRNKLLTIHHTITQTVPTDTNIVWSGRTGRITNDMVKELIPNWPEVEFYVVGPAQMVLDLKKQLKEMGVTDQNLISELFTGY